MKLFKHLYTITILSAGVACQEAVHVDSDPSCDQVLNPEFVAKNASKITYEMGLKCRAEREVLNAQLLKSLGIPQEEACATEKKLTPENLQAMSEAEQLLENLALARQNGEGPQFLVSGEIYEIPVVVHVIHLGEEVGSASNISQAQIDSAITALNNQFRKVAGTTGDGSGVDTQVQFVLAKRDENNLPHSGVNRVNGSSVPKYASEGINATGGAVGAEESAVKNLSRWDRDKYYNIWVVTEIDNNNGGGGIQGYAYFPSSSASVDGTAIMHSAFGTVGTVKPSANHSKVLTHEVGHGFGLFHTFQATNSCSSESNCLTSGDKVCDTPVTILNSDCANPACSGTQQVQNYMDYTPQACINKYTQNQKERMRDSALNLRSSLLTSLGGQPVNSIDAAITSFSGVSQYFCMTSLQPSVTLENWGSSVLTSATLRYRVDGGSWNNTTFNGSLASGATTSITLTAVSSLSAGDHTLQFEVTNPNGSTDQNTANNLLNSNITIPSASNPFTVSVTTDYFGSETKYSIKSGGSTLYVGQGFPNAAQGTIIAHQFCLPAACYDVVFEDGYGDGQGFTNGGYSILSGTGQTLFSNLGNWGSIQTHNVCIGGSESPADTTAPTVSISSPSNNSNYTTLQTVTINATANDANGISQVQFFDNGVLKGSDSTSPYTHSWVITNTMNGSHKWTAKAFDLVSLSTESAIKTYTVNVPGGTSIDTNAPPPSLLPDRPETPSNEEVAGDIDRSPSSEKLDVVDGIGACATVNSGSGPRSGGSEPQQVFNWFFPFLVMFFYLKTRMVKVRL